MTDFYDRVMVEYLAEITQQRAMTRLSPIDRRLREVSDAIEAVWSFGMPRVLQKVGGG